VDENKLQYTEHEVTNTKRARKLYHSIGAPSTKNFKMILQSNMIKNCPVTVQDIDLAMKIYGPDIAYLKGKMV